MAESQAAIFAHVDVFRDYALFAAVMVVMALALRRFDLTATRAGS